ncbi:MAG: chemotaxis protein CheX [Brevundimonas sp.]|nr:chemotaxis protein CheX [Brevundimonas sp.]
MTTPAQAVLPAVLDLQYAEPLRAELLELRGRPVTLDASAVDRLGGLCLQVLISAQKSWAADGQMLSIAPMSDAFADQWKMFGAADAAAELGDAA